MIKLSKSSKHSKVNNQGFNKQEKEKQIMKKRFLLIALIISFTMVTNCAMLGPAVKKEPATKAEQTEAKIEAAKSAATTDEGILIKINKEEQSQKALVEAVRVLEKLYSTPLVLISGGLATTGSGEKVSIVRYALYFEISESMYTVVSISNGMITEIIPVNRSGRVLATMKMSVEKVLKASGIGKDVSDDYLE